MLIADDQPAVLEALHLLLKGDGFMDVRADSPKAALDAIRREEFDVALVDLNYARDTTSGRENLDLLARVQGIDETLSVVVMTAWGSVELAVEAMRRGARDFVQKPWDDARLLSILRTQSQLTRAMRRGRCQEAERRAILSEGLPPLVAESPTMKPVVDLVDRIAQSDANLLITGESGTGKNVIARLAHAMSSRTGKPFIAVNMGGLADSLFESELFGHLKGAFTVAKADRIGRFEMADGGTLFLDEIANVPMKQQAKLLQVVESGEFEPIGSSHTRRADVRDPLHLRRVGGNSAFHSRKAVPFGNRLFAAAAFDGLAVLDPYRPPLELRPVSSSRENPYQFLISGAEGMNVSLQRSTNLTVWESWLSLTLEKNAIQVSDTDNSPRGRRFYRAKKE